MLPKESNLDFDFPLESERSGEVNEPAFQMLVLGDWSADGTKSELAVRRPIEIDRDNFDDVMNSLGVRLRTAAAAELEFNSLDDFHPDEIYKRVPAFAQLRELRKRLRNPDTFNSASRELREMLGVNDKEAPSQLALEPVTDGSSLLDVVLSKPSGGAEVPKTNVSDDLSRLVSDLVRPHLVSVDENEQSSLIAAVDEATSSLMRSILHDRGFQLLEAAWRGLFFLVRRTDTSSDLKIFIFNVSKHELASDLRNAADLGNSTLAKLVSAGQRNDPWAALFGNFAFVSDVDDTASLVRLAKIGASCGVPFISHIRPEVLGIRSLAEHPDPADWYISGDGGEGKLWAALRSVPESRFLGLLMPRFLARLPYGADTEPAETFSFEEFTDEFAHDDYLWANGCFAAAQMLGATYREFGWDFEQRFVQDVDGLPLHLHKLDGESFHQSCAEVQLSQTAAERLMEHGIMPLASFKNTDRIRLARFQSISDPVTALKGRWS